MATGGTGRSLRDYEDDDQLVSQFQKLSVNASGSYCEEYFFGLGLFVCCVCIA